MSASDSRETRVPTQQFLLPGQQFCVGLPWERAELPKHGLPPAPFAAPPQANPFDQAELAADPCAGWEIGACQVIRRLSSNSASSLLAMHADPAEGTALVVLRKLELPHEGLQDLFEHARWAAHFRHPHLARVYGCEASDEGLFWVTEFASGATLHELSATCRKIGKAVPVGFALSTAYETALALAELHVPGGHAHGFVSDESVFTTFDGHSKLLDLGLFRCIAGKILRPEGLAAMAPYLAPEQVKGGRMPSPTTDIYALAAVLHECLSGRKLPNGFEREPHFVPPSSFNVALSKELDAVVLRALDPDRSKRYRSGAEFAKALKEAAAAFMWKPQQRAEFVERLFQTRKRREQVLLAGCEEVAWKPKRQPTAPKLPAVVEPKPTTQMRVVAPPAAAVVKPTPAAKPVRKSRARVLALALVATGLGFVYQRALVDTLLFPRAPAAWAARAAAKLAHAPLPLPEASGAQAELVESVSSAEKVRAVYASAKPRAAAPKKKRDDAPLPPWLQPKRR